MTDAACFQGLPNRQVNDQHQIAVICFCGWTSEWIDVRPSPRAAKAIVQGQHEEHLVEMRSKAMRGAS